MPIAATEPAFATYAASVTPAFIQLDIRFRRRRDDALRHAMISIEG